MTGEMANIPGDRLPSDHPQPHTGPIDGPSIWYGPEMMGDDIWIEELKPIEKAELLDAMRGVSDFGTDLQRIERRNFPLPTLGARLDTLRKETIYGRGFVLLRGVPIDGLSLEQTAALYWGIGSYIGNPRPQNARGHLLGHVTDIEGAVVEQARGYLTNRHLPYHCDYVDIVTLLCLRKARTGGLSSLVSSHTIHNEIWAERPDLAKVLYGPAPRDRHEEVPPGKGPWYELPVFNHYEGWLSIYIIRRHIDSTRVYPDAPRVSPELTEALDMVEALANDPRLNMTMAFEPGDMQIVHNHQIMHDRTAYEDWEERDRRRYLLRLWLAPPDGVPLPSAFAGLYGSTKLGMRGGVSEPRITPHVSLEPV